MRKLPRWPWHELAEPKLPKVAQSPWGSFLGGPRITRKLPRRPWHVLADPGHPGICWNMLAYAGICRNRPEMGKAKNCSAKVFQTRPWVKMVSIHILRTIGIAKVGKGWQSSWTDSQRHHEICHIRSKLEKKVLGQGAPKLLKLGACWPNT